MLNTIQRLQRTDLMNYDTFIDYFALSIGFKPLPLCIERQKNKQLYVYLLISKWVYTLQCSHSQHTACHTL